MEVTQAWRGRRLGGGAGNGFWDLGSLRGDARDDGHVAADQSRTLVAGHHKAEPAQWPCAGRSKSVREHQGERHRDDSRRRGYEDTCSSIRRRSMRSSSMALRLLSRYSYCPARHSLSIASHNVSSTSQLAHRVTQLVDRVTTAWEGRFRRAASPPSAQPSAPSHLRSRRRAAACRTCAARPIDDERTEVAVGRPHGIVRLPARTRPPHSASRLVRLWHA